MSEIEETTKKEGPEVSLHGKYSHKVDAKGRVSLPSIYRKALPLSLMITVSPERDCLQVFTPSDFDNWVNSVFEDRFGKFDNSNTNHIRAMRALITRTVDLLQDNAGRIKLPPEQCEAVGIDKDVIISGGRGFFEIWDAKRFEEQDSDSDKYLEMLFGPRES